MSPDAEVAALEREYQERLAGDINEGLVGRCPTESETRRFWILWKEDFRRCASGGTETAKTTAEMGTARRVIRYASVATVPGVWVILIYRIAAAFDTYAPLGRIPARMLEVVNSVVFGCDLNPAGRVGPGLVLPHAHGCGFSDSVRIGRNCTLFRGCAVGGAADVYGNSGFPVIGDDVMFLDRSVVVGPVTIGNKVILGPVAGVNRSVPAGSFVFGPRLMRPPVPLNKVVPRSVIDATEEMKVVRERQKERGIKRSRGRGRESRDTSREKAAARAARAEAAPAPAAPTNGSGTPAAEPSAEV